MGGLGFIHAGFLAAGLAVAVPIIVHLLFRQQARRMEVGTLRFLKIALRNQARRRRVRRWVLLAMRGAGVLLLAVLFARPYWVSSQAPGREREVALLIDRSASMGAGGRRTPFDRAQEQASRLLEGMPDGTAMHVAYFDSSEVSPTSDHAIDPALAPAPVGTDYGKALAWARDVMVMSTRADRRVYLLTDLQRSGIGRTPLDRFPESVRLEVEDVGRPVTKNLAIDDVSAGKVSIRPGEPVQVAARVLNAGPFAVRDVVVRLALDGPEPIRRERTVSLAGSERRVVRFEIPVTAEGLYRGYVEVAEGDDLAFDDRRWIAFEAREPSRVLLVDGDPGASVFGNETYYLETALRLRLPGREPTRDDPPTPFEPERIAGDGRLPDLGRFDAVVLCNSADLPGAASDRLASFVREGGALVIFAGPKVGPGSYASLLADGIAPAAPDGEVEGSFRFASREPGHPIFRPFDDPQHGDPRSLRFRTIARLKPAPEGRVIASAGGGEPLVVERTVGRGRCLLVAVPADNAWGDWAVDRLYVPLIHQMIGHATGRLPDDARVREEPATVDSGQGPGIEQEREQVVVRNVDPAESQIEKASEEELRRAYRLSSAEESTPDGEEPATPVAGSTRPDEVWRFVAWALLVLLVAETFVANRTQA